MPPKKVTKLKEKPQADPDFDSSAVPPALPPSVEEAYRRKCVQLKQRTNEVEEENDATRIRLARIKRQVEKMRIERAFLLEQIARRTSTNVEDSEGSPSPPPTPQDKPLRTKRGHRKPSILADMESGAPTKSNAASPSQGMHGGSPASDDRAASAGPSTNGVPKAPKKPLNAFELYCEDARPALIKSRENKDDNDDKGDGDELTVDEELAQGWRDLPERERKPFVAKHEEEMAEYQKEKEKFEAAKEKKRKRKSEAEAEAKKDDAPAKKADDREESPAGAENEDDEAKNEEQDDKTTPAPAEKKRKESPKEDEETKKKDARSGSAEAPATKPTSQDEDVEMADGDDDDETHRANDKDEDQD